MTYRYTNGPAVPSWLASDGTLRMTAGKVSGAWVFTGTRIPLYALYENLAGGATVDEFVEWFPSVDEAQVRIVSEHEANELREALEA